MKDDFSLKGEIIEALESITDTATNKNLVEAHMVEAVNVAAGIVDLVIIVAKDRAREDRIALEDAIYDTIEAVDGVREVKIKLMSAEAIKKEASGEVEAAPAPKPAAPKPAAAAGSVPSSSPIEGVSKVIAIASGKGGVGKSTVAANVALALKKLGYRVGLLDVDIYGPSLPTLFGITGKPAVRERRIVPLEAMGLRVMSLGFLMEDDTPVIWRGPIVTGIIRQFLRDVDWSGLDYLIVDMPPGTGDAQLALAQTVPVDGAVIVTTPSDLALIDAARGLQMFKTLNIEVLGIVENMSKFICPSCGTESFIFGQGTVEVEAKRLDTKVLGTIPLDIEVRKSGDEGRPIVESNDKSPVTLAFMALAESLAAQMPLEAPDEKASGKKGLFSFLKG